MKTQENGLLRDMTPEEVDEYQRLEAELKERQEAAQEPPLQGEGE